MNKFIDKINEVIHNISINFVRILLIVIVIGMLCINSVYLYIDSAGFQAINVYNYLGIILNILWLVIIVAISKFIKNKYINLVLFAIYFIAEFIYLKMVPIKPFSDMEAVLDIVQSGFKTGIEYLQRYPNNLPISIIFYLLLKIHDGVLIIKLFNVVCNIVTIYFAYMIYKNIYKENNNLVLLLGISSISTFMYVNMAYNDVIFVTLITIILYILTKNEYDVKDIILLSLLSFLQFIIRPVGIILIIAECMFLILKKYNFKIVSIVLAVFAICNLLYIPIQKHFIPESGEKMQYPIWSFLQMGINEKEFGFQDQSHSVNWRPNDIINRVKELGPKRLAKLLVKKEYWLWTEGTYQVERYAFGAGGNNVYYYETPLTSKLLNPETSKIRKALDYIMKGQYFVIALLALIGIISKEKDEEIKNKRDLLLYFIIGMGCFYLIWEIKSRYIYCLYPVFLILATNGIYKITSKIERRKVNENINNGK